MEVGLSRIDESISVDTTLEELATWQTLGGESNPENRIIVDADLGTDESREEVESLLDTLYTRFYGIEDCVNHEPDTQSDEPDGLEQIPPVRINFESEQEYEEDGTWDNLNHATNREISSGDNNSKLKNGLLKLVRMMSRNSKLSALIGVFMLSGGCENNKN